MWSTFLICVCLGPRGVSELRFQSNNSTALWVPGTTQQSAVVFLYELSLENGSTIQSSRLMDTELHLSGLEEGKTYVLDVWEECDGQWESEHYSLYIERANSSLQLLVRAAGPDQGRGQFEVPLVWQVSFKHQENSPKLEISYSVGLNQIKLNYLWWLNHVHCVSTL